MFMLFCKLNPNLGALNDFDADSQASSRDKGADAAEDKANAEIWNQVS